MILERDGRPQFPLGMYERPRDDGEWKAWSEAGINIVCCHTREQLDQALAHGMSAWIPVPMIVADDEGEERLRATVEELRDHPAVAVWEAPDEAIWCTLMFGDDRAFRLWQEPEERVQEVRRRRDAVVAGLARGAKLIRKLDPGRPLWLNEATGSDFDTLARCLPNLDIVGFDFYPVPPSIERPLHEWGPMLDRYRRVAPHHGIWAVQQAFSWSTLPKHGAGKAPAYPNEEQARFAAWQAFMHSATGIMWWGSAQEDRPAPFIDEIMVAVAEMSRLQPYLTTGRRHSVGIHLDDQMRPAVLGVSGGAYRSGIGTMLALLNEDPWEHEVVLTGFNGNPNELTSVVPGTEPFVRIPDGWATVLQGYEVRIHVSDNGTEESP